MSDGDGDVTGTIVLHTRQETTCGHTCTTRHTLDVEVPGEDDYVEIYLDRETHRRLNQRLGADKQLWTGQKIGLDKEEVD